MSEMLGLVVRSLEADPAVIGFVLARRRRQYAWDDTMLAAWLRMPAAQLPRLQLCRRPDIAGADVADQVAAIAEYTGCDADRLMSLLRSGHE